MAKKEFITEVDYNKSAKACPTCSLACEKINNRINNRKLSEIKLEEIPHILKVLNLQSFHSIGVRDLRESPFFTDTSILKKKMFFA